MNKKKEVSELLPTYTIDDIRKLKPCYDPVTGEASDGEQINDGYLDESWCGTALDILAVDESPIVDRLWVVCHEGWINSDRVWRFWTVWCARQALSLIENPDPRSIQVCDIAERYANGEATDEELAAVGAAARAAAWDAWDAARAAAWAAWDAAWAAQIKQLRFFIDEEIKARNND